MRQSRLDRERRTLASMIEIYCHARHQQAVGLCAECEQLLAYAMQRIDKCPFQENKPTCAKCTIHCYKPQMRQQVREVNALCRTAHAIASSDPYYYALYG